MYYLEPLYFSVHFLLQDAVKRCRLATACERNCKRSILIIEIDIYIHTHTHRYTYLMILTDATEQFDSEGSEDVEQ